MFRFLSTSLCLLLGGALFGQSVLAQTLYINEYMASNDTTVADPAGGFDDWVEIYNPGSSAVDLGGMYATDDLTTPDKWQIPAGTGQTLVPAGGYLVLWFDGEPAQGPLHIDTKLSGGGEQIGLFRSDLTPVDTLSYGPQSTDVSEGRVPDGGSTFAFFPSPTPGAANETGTSGRTATPTASVDAGIKSSSFTVALDVATPSAQIYYTTDATEPDGSSMPYTGPIFVDDTTVLRARAFSDGLLDSYVATYTYLFNVAHSSDFAVVAVTLPPEDLFGENGIYTKFEEDIEVGAHFELFEPNGTVGVSQGVETEIHGSASASLPQKSLAIKADATYGDEEIRYPVFPDQPYDVYRSLILRNSGQDWNYTMFRDAAASSLVRDLSDVGDRIQPVDVIAQGSRPGVLYLNGEYWGIHNLRDRFDHRYILARYGLTRNQIDFIDEENDVRDGDVVAWNQYQSFLQGANLSDASQFQTFSGWVDPSEFIDYNVFQIIIDNADWPGNNNRRFREKAAGARWNYMIKDLDFTTGLFVDEGPWNSGDWTQNSLERLADEAWDWWPDPPWSTLAIRRALENDGFRTDFINRSADMLNVLFDPVRWNARIDEFVVTYDPEMQPHLDRWNGGWNNWQSHVGKLRLFASNRAPEVRNHYVGFFPEVTGTAAVQLSVAGQGSFSFSTVKLSGNGDSTSGLWFTGVDIPVRAVPCSGGVFERWSGASTATSPEITVNLSGDSSLTAHFSGGDCGSASVDVVFNEIHYHPSDALPSGDWVELYNAGLSAVDLSGFTFADDADGLDSFVLPQGTVLAAGDYLVLAADSAALFASFPDARNVIGDFGGDTGFGLSNGGELLVLSNASGSVVDQVEYDDAAPWPTEPDGDGPSLSLIDSGLDNGLASSWVALTPTPGRLNADDPGGPEAQTISFGPLPQRTTDSAPFDVAATASSGLPVSFEIVSGPATIAGSTITLAGTAGTVVVRATQPGNADWLSAPPVDRSFAVIVPSTGGPMPTGYCSSSGSQPWQSWNDIVRFAGIDHDSEKEKYGDFTSLEAQVQRGSAYPIELHPAYSWERFLNTWRVYIDWTRDGDFDDPGELVLDVSATNLVVNGQIVVPAGASQGITRMRVTMKRNEPAGACETFVFGEVQDYAVVISGDGGGEQQAQSIDFGPLPDRPIDSTPFDVAATASSGLPVSYEIVSGPASISGATITLSGNLGTIVVRATQAGDANWLPAAPVERSFAVVDNNSGGGPMPTGYCSSIGSQPWQSWNDIVRFIQIDHDSEKERYGDFTDRIAFAARSSNHTLELVPAYSWERFLNTWRVWIDWNRDGDFDDAGELVADTAPSNEPVLVTLTVPANASVGTTRMRVTMKRDQPASACESFTYGEVQDYAVEIQ